MSANDEDMAVMERAAQILHDEPSCSGKRALAQARHELTKERQERHITWIHGTTPDRRNAIAHVVVDGRNIAGAVLNSDGSQWVLTSNLPYPQAVSGARVSSVSAAEMWLHFLADLYTGVYR